MKRTRTRINKFNNGSSLTKYVPIFNVPTLDKTPVTSATKQVTSISDPGNPVATKESDSDMPDMHIDRPTCRWCWSSQTCMR